MFYCLSFVLGIIQGITEFLPISSSGHLIIFRDVLRFQINDSLSFDVALHLGTLLAIIIFFRKDICRLISAWLSSFQNLKSPTDFQRLSWLIILGSMPAALAGLFLADAIEQYLRREFIVIITLILFGIIFLIVEKRYSPKREMKDLTWKTALGIGLAQMVALIPGVSRSGITIITGMGLKLQRTEAARFSFLLGIPAIAGAAIFSAVKLDYNSLNSGDYLAFSVGISSSAIIGFLAIKFLLAILKQYGMRPFAYYRFILAAILIIYFLVK
ncbi:MAG: undecaprenyl-diphosphatase UppP [Patescibacteria group bacterium]